MNKIYIVVCVVIIIGIGNIARTDEKKIIPIEEVFKANIKTFPMENANVSEIDLAMIQSACQLLPASEVEECLKNFNKGKLLLYDNPKRFIILIQLKDAASAQRFMNLEEKLLHEKDECYPHIIIKKGYSKFKNNTVLIARKETKYMEEVQLVTCAISIHQNYLLEINLLTSEYSNEKMLEFIVEIWQAIEIWAAQNTSEAKWQNSAIAKIFYFFVDTDKQIS